jgi:hypothetical protein
MRASRNRATRFLTDPSPAGHPVFHSLSSFYREEFVRCQRCLEQQREFYSARTIDDMERALRQVMSQIDSLCTSSNADKVVSHLLRQFNIVAGLSNWSDPKQVN